MNDSKNVTATVKTNERPATSGFFICSNIIGYGLSLPILSIS
jgi:hypothetical protein